ncbi:hypothetical protein [Nocardioides sp. SYSU D00038]|uniref:hypothetical protein n=1 Tax=Nocardioides sp. SYSU D00038 TaxID=2812554 RepID=UPI0019670F43|nr:hypothetical protein [Nocardioides sp. SYSU D00038]
MSALERLVRRTVLGVVACGVVVAALLVRDPGEDDAGAGAAEPSSPPPVTSIETFCPAFERMAVTHANNLANGTEVSRREVEEAARQVRELGSALPVPEPIRAGLEGFVAGLLGEPSQATTVELAEFSRFLETACPATY